MKAKASRRDAVLSIVMVLLVSSLIIVKVADRFDVPGLGDFSNGTISDLEARSYQPFPRFTKGDFVARVFQENADQYLADLTPCRDEVILGNASFQRAFIRLSAQLFGYKTYPTFYGSSRVYDTELDSVLPIPPDPSGGRARQCARLAEAINGFSEANPDLMTVFCLVGSMEFSPFDPLRDLMSRGEDNMSMVDDLLSSLREEVVTVNLEIADESDYLKNYYKTDHHWNIFGAYEGYATVMAAISPDEEPVSITGTRSWDVPFYGTYARVGLFRPPMADVIEDIEYDLSNLSVSVNGEASALEDVLHVERYNSGRYSSSVFKNRYGEYFHGDSSHAYIRFDNEDVSGDESLLIVGDSYTNSIERLFAEHFKTVHCIDLRYFDGTVQSVVEDNGVDVVLFMESLGNYTNDTFIENIS